jgi:hypothetical protein
MKINGVYKFDTKAIVDKFISLYLKVEFYSGSTKLSADEFASALTSGYITSFNRLNGDVSVVYPTDPGFTLDLSLEVKVTLIAVNGKNRILYIREFPNFLQYSLLTPERRALFPDINFNSGDNTDGIQFFSGSWWHFSLASIKAYVEINPDNSFSVYGMISPNSNLGLCHSYTYPSFIITGYIFNAGSYRRLTRHFLNSVYFPALSFKDYEPLVEIGSLSRTEPIHFNQGDGLSSLVGSSLINHFSYIGGGLWNSHYGFNVFQTDAIGWRGGLYESSFAHVYPNTSISPPVRTSAMTMAETYAGFSVSKTSFIDVGNSYSNYCSVPENTGIFYNPKYSPKIRPLTKDSKNGDLYSCELFTNQPTTYQNYAKTFKNGIEIDFDYISKVNDDLYNTIFGTDESLWYPGIAHTMKPVFFVYDENVYTCEIVYEQDKGKNNIELRKNVPYKHPNNPNTYYNSIDPLLTEKTPQKFKLENSELFKEFMDALLENYPSGYFPPPYAFTTYEEYMVRTNKERLIIPELYCYSASTKTMWKYCNSIFTPDEIEWQNID